MDNIVEVIFAVGFLLFTVFAFVRRSIEQRDIEKRNSESPFDADDLPEETRRMLFGEPRVPTARPAQPQRSPDPFVEVTDVLRELRRQFEPVIAKPKQDAPSPPALPQQRRVEAAPRQPHPLQPQFKPAQQQPPRPPAQRQAPRTAPPRMVTPQSEGAMPKQVPVQQQRPAPQQRRQQRPPVRVVEEDEGPRMPFPLPSQKKQRPKPVRRRSRWLASPDDLRRGIVLSEILGPPKAFQ